MSDNPRSEKRVSGTSPGDPGHDHDGLGAKQPAGVGLLLLPGMDGTGRLFGPFVDQLPRDVWTKVVSYPADRIMGYEDLMPLVETQVEHSVPHVLIAESFSGPLVVEYACRRTADVAAVVLCGSFVSNPLPHGFGWLPMLAHPAITALATREFVIRTFLLDSSAPANLVADVRDAIRMVKPEVLVARMRAVSAVNVAETLKQLQVPVLYITARRDRVIGARGARQIRASAPSAEIQILDAPHLILQKRPSEAATMVLKFLTAHGVIQHPLNTANQQPTE